MDSDNIDEVRNTNEQIAKFIQDTFAYNAQCKGQGEPDLALRTIETVKLAIEDCVQKWNGTKPDRALDLQNFIFVATHSIRADLDLDITAERLLPLEAREARGAYNAHADNQPDVAGDNSNGGAAEDPHLEGDEQQPQAMQQAEQHPAHQHE